MKLKELLESLNKNEAKKGVSFANRIFNALNRANKVFDQSNDVDYDYSEDVNPNAVKITIPIMLDLNDASKDEKNIINTVKKINTQLKRLKGIRLLDRKDLTLGKKEDTGYTYVQWATATINKEKK